MHDSVLVRSCTALLMAAILLPMGCVRRRMTIRSSPPGATVYVDDQQIGTTPASTSYVYYGTRKVQLVRDGYETLTVQHKFSPPWYQIPPLDFISENLIPYELRDERILELEMEPQRLVSVPDLVQRAEQLRDSSQATAAPTGARSPAYQDGPVSNPGRGAKRYPPPYSAPPTELPPTDSGLPPAYFPDRLPADPNQ